MGVGELATECDIVVPRVGTGIPQRPGDERGPLGEAVVRVHAGRGALLDAARPAGAGVGRRLCRVAKVEAARRGQSGGRGDVKPDLTGGGAWYIAVHGAILRYAAGAEGTQVAMCHVAHCNFDGSAWREAGAEGGPPDTGSCGGKARGVTRDLAGGRRISRCPTATARQRESWRVESSEGERGSAGDSPALPLEPFLPRISGTSGRRARCSSSTRPRRSVSSPAWRTVAKRRGATTSRQRTISMNNRPPRASRAGRSSVPLGGITIPSTSGSKPARSSLRTTTGSCPGVLIFSRPPSHRAPRSGSPLCGGGGAGAGAPGGGGPGTGGSGSPHSASGRSSVTSSAVRCSTLNTAMNCCV